MKHKFLIISILVLIIGSVAGCKTQEKNLEPLIIETPTAKQIQEEPASLIDEGEILEIPLPKPINNPDAEISGIDWYGDKLVLLPQYPGRFKRDGYGSLFMIQKSEILDYIIAPDGNAIQIERIKFDDAGISEQLKGFEGFEAIAFYGNHFYVTVETKPGASMLGYVYRGTFEPDLISMTIEAEVYQAIKPQAWFANASEEAILVYNDSVYTFFEDYGLHKNNNPVVHKFDLDLKEVGTISMEQIEYRITDVTGPDEEGKFWGMNYFYPGDVHLLPANDPITEKFGEGETHQLFVPVERLVAFQITENGINILDQSPLQFRLLPENEARNWEGLVLLDELGFLVVTDRFPSTILGFYEFLR